MLFSVLISNNRVHASLAKIKIEIKIYTIYNNGGLVINFVNLLFCHANKFSRFFFSRQSLYYVIFYPIITLPFLLFLHSFLSLFFNSSSPSSSFP